jgi:hypothetical protein
MEIPDWTEFSLNSQNPSSNCSKGQEAFSDTNIFFNHETFANLICKQSPIYYWAASNQWLSQWVSHCRSGDFWVTSEPLLNGATDYNLRMSARWKWKVKVPRSLMAAQLIHCDCFYGWSWCIQYVRIYLQGRLPTSIHATSADVVQPERNGNGATDTSC